MLNRILGEEVRDNQGKYENEGKYGIRKCRRQRKHVEGKGRGMWKEVRWSGHAQEDFGISVGQSNWEVRGIEGSAAGKEVREWEARHKQRNNCWRKNRKESKNSEEMRDSWRHIGRRWCFGVAVFSLSARWASPSSSRLLQELQKDLGREMRDKHMASIDSACKKVQEDKEVWMGFIKQQYDYSQTFNYKQITKNCPLPKLPPFTILLVRI